MFKCTCGSKTLGHPGHSIWCDINGSLQLQSGWDEFIALMNSFGTGGIYVYITTDWYKLSTLTNWSKGIFRVVTPSEYKTGAKYLGVTCIWIDKDCVEPVIMDILKLDIGPNGRVEICPN